MKASEIKKVVKILISDGDLLVNWKEFFDELDLKNADYIRLNKQIKKDTLTHYELFSEILNLWISVNSALETDIMVQKLIEVLKGNGSNLVAEKLENTFGIRSQIDEKVPIWFEVGRATSNFVGRSNELKELEELFNSKKSSCVVTTTGMGGVGKSELVKNFAKELAGKNAVDCIWINGESRESLKNSITRFQNFLKLSKFENNDPVMTVDEVFVYAISTIKRNSRVLVIVDNVDEANEDVQKLISRIPVHRCFFLVTSRNVSVLECAGTIIRLDTLAEVEAVNLLKTSGISEPDEEIEKLCNLLGNFPLALHQAAAYIKMQKLTGDEAYKISDYMEIYESQKRTLLDYKLNQIEHEYRETTLITWKISFEKIQKNEEFGDLATQLLNTIAYFEPDGIEVEFLNLYQKGLEGAIPLIKTYSLVKFEHGRISIHRLVQQVIQLNLDARQLEAQHLMQILTAVQPILEPVQRSIGVQEKLNINKSPILLKHIECGIVHIVSVWKYGMTSHPELLNEFQNVFIDTMYNLRHFKLVEQIIDLGNTAQSQLKNIVVGNTELMLRIESELAYLPKIELDITFLTEKTGRILSNLQEVYAKQKEHSGEENKATLTTAHYIAEIHNKWDSEVSGRDKEEWWRKVVALKTKVFGPLHKSTLSTKLLFLNHMVDIQKSYTEAAKLYEECFQWQMTHLGADGRGTYDIFNQYVKCLLKADKYEEARVIVEAYLQQELTPFKGDVCIKLSLVLFCLGEIEEAFSTFTQGIENYNPKNAGFNISKLQYKHASSFLKKKNYFVALAMYQKLEVDKYEYSYAGRWLFIYVKYKEAQCLVALKRFRKARKSIKSVCESLKYYVGDNSKPLIEMNELLEDINKHNPLYMLSRFRTWIQRCTCNICLYTPLDD